MHVFKHLDKDEQKTGSHYEVEITLNVQEHYVDPSCPKYNVYNKLCVR